MSIHNAMTVEEFLGYTIKLDSDTGKFFTRVKGDIVEDRSLNKLKEKLASSIKVADDRKVDVVYAWLSSTVSPEAAHIERITIDGISTYKEHSRAPLVVRLTSNRGNKAINQTYKLVDEGVLQELDFLRRDWMQANKDFYSRTKELMDRLEDVSSEAIIKSLLTGKPIVAGPKPQSSDDTSEPLAI